MNNFMVRSVGRIVVEDYRSAAIFEKYGIDFCCNGNQNLSDVCTKKGLDSSIVLNELAALQDIGTVGDINYSSWSLDALVDYIENRHHCYVKQRIPEIMKCLDKICQVHGKRHRELLEIRYLFQESARQLATHMKKEELVLFPFIIKMAKSFWDAERIAPPKFAKVRNPIEMMTSEHDTEGKRFRQIEELSNMYTPPEDACNTYIVTYKLLKGFQEDLHVHMHLENNILFPKAEALEDSLFEKSI